MGLSLRSPTTILQPLTSLLLAGDEGCSQQESPPKRTPRIAAVSGSLSMA